MPCMKRKVPTNLSKENASRQNSTRLIKKPANNRK